MNPNDLHWTNLGYSSLDHCVCGCMLGSHTTGNFTHWVDPYRVCDTVHRGDAGPNHQCPGFTPEGSPEADPILVLYRELGL